MGEFPYVEDFIMIDEFIVGTSSIRYHNTTSICSSRNFNNQSSKLSNVSITPITINEGEGISFQCLAFDVSDYPFMLGMEPENISTFTWSLHAAPDGFSEDELIATIAHSLLEWSHEIPVDFNYIGRYINANVTISFHTTLNHAILHKNQSRNCSSSFNLFDVAHAAPIDHADEKARGHIHFNGFQRNWSM